MVKEFFAADIGDDLFSRRRAVEEFDAERAAKRKPPRDPSHMKRNETRRVGAKRRPPAEKYNRLSYLTALTRACDRACPLPAALAKRAGEAATVWKARLTEKQQAELTAWRKAHHRHPDQRRHTFATRVRKQHGLEAAQVLLGHPRADVTQVYAERNDQLAAAVAAKIG